MVVVVLVVIVLVVAVTVVMAVVVAVTVVMVVAVVMMVVMVVAVVVVEEVNRRSSGSNTFESAIMHGRGQSARIPLCTAD
mmetsp:Transcript_66178/g.141636  ORF Transcript_66178/g.141636 Transcript_66178/m.141636 type:complete len:80 (+) Transcript_66178:712-951(+)